MHLCYDRTTSKAISGRNQVEWPAVAAHTINGKCRHTNQQYCSTTRKVCNTGPATSNQQPATSSAAVLPVGSACLLVRWRRRQASDSRTCPCPARPGSCWPANTSPAHVMVSPALSTGHDETKPSTGRSESRTVWCHAEPKRAAATSTPQC